MLTAREKGAAGILFISYSQATARDSLMALELGTSDKIRELSPYMPKRTRSAKLFSTG